MIRPMFLVFAALAFTTVAFAEDVEQEGELLEGLCCSPDLIFIVDITDGLGFSRNICESYIREFMDEIMKKTTRRRCNEVRGAVIEYGRQARIKYDFNRYPSTAAFREALSEYTPGNSLGGPSNAHTGFKGANLLITNPSRGHREDSTVTIFWIVQSTPADLSALDDIIGELKANQQVQIAIVAVGDYIDLGVVGPYASSLSYFYPVDKIKELLQYCGNIKVDYCPAVTTTTTTTTVSTLPDVTTQKTTTKSSKSKTTATLPDATTTKSSGKKATTTASQPNAPIFPDAVPADDFCFSSSNRRNHRDLYADETECHHYYQCFFMNETTAYGIRRVCPVGTFWHDSVLQCMPEGPVPCFDRCMQDATAAAGCYAGTGCRQFYVCANTASYGMCCPEGTAFDATSCSCLESATCFDDCVQQGPVIPTTVAPSNSYNATVCQDSWGTYISAVAGLANAFSLIDVEGNPTTVQYCPTGVNFDLSTCSCSAYDENAFAPSATVKRQALLWLTFDNNLQDQSVNKFATFAYDNVERDASVSAYGGGSLSVNNGYLSIPGLKSFDSRGNGSWCAFFRCESGSGYSCSSSGGIISNNKDSSSSEYTAIFGIQGSNSFTGRLNFWHPVGAQAVNAPVNVPSDGWNHFCATYNGNTISLYLNGALADSENVGGYLSIAHTPYVIGTDQGLGSFSGHIDDVLFTTFPMTTDEINAHRNGDRNFLRSLGLFN